MAPMQHTREEALNALSALGVEITQNKISLELINRKLSKALEHAQRMNTLLKLDTSSAVGSSPSSGEPSAGEPSSASTKIDPTKLKTWKSVSKVPLLDASNHANLGEASLYKAAKGPGDTASPFPMGSNVFMDLRQTVMSLGLDYDKDMKLGILQNKEQTSCIAFRIVEAYSLSAEDPVFIIAYMHATRINAFDAIFYMKRARRHGQPNGQLVQIFATIAEQKLFLKIMEDNQKRLVPGYSNGTSKSSPLTKLEKKLGFQASFVIPPSPLSMVEIGSLAQSRGCESCGKKADLKCSGCHSVAYCGKDCQTSDWASHKYLCKTLCSGTWIPLRFFIHVQTVPGSDVVSTMHWNRFTQLRDIRKPSFSKFIDTSKPAPSAPPNTHGDRPFLVKIQRCLAEPSLMLIYDRKRTFMVNVTVEGGTHVPFVDRMNPGVGPGAVSLEVFDKVADEMLRTGFLGAKMFRWAKRTGEWEMSVCLDREPKENVQW